ncbi:hypothetical protein Ancab_035647 [Ancistrocladus abbreviatus]
MDGRGGCCIARYAGGGAAYHDMSQYDRIMLRFRPIAPKPVVGSDAQGGAKAESKVTYVKTGRGRRRCIKDNNNNSSNSNNSNGKRNNSGGRKRKSCSPEGKLPHGVEAQENTVVTLPLLPEMPDLTAAVVKRQDHKLQDLQPKTLSFSDGQVRSVPVVFGGVDQSVVVKVPPQQQEVIVGSSFVTVECVTDTWVDGNGLGCTDEEKRRTLEEDTCPGFISDGWNRVWWANEAYRKLVATRGGEEGAGTVDNVMVWLVMKEKAPISYPAFTCRVRVQNTWHGKEKGNSTTAASSSLTLPCDAWRMENGGFAWRLDVKAALSLGR